METGGKRTPIVDQIRVVPEMAVRLYLGAEAEPSSNGTVLLQLDYRQYYVEQEVYDRAEGICRALKVQDRVPIEYASDVLELRHAAEDLFLKDLLPSIEGPSILFAPAGTQMASAYVRAAVPATIMMERGVAISHHTYALDLSKAMQYDILWVQLISSPLIISIAREAQKHGVKVVYDVDDRFDVIPDDNLASQLYTEQYVENVWKMIQLADMVTVSTKNLAEHIRSRARAVKVLPNMVLATLWPPVAPIDDKIFRILWAGSNTHQRDLVIVVPALKNILRDYDGKVRFTLLGETLPAPLIPVKQFVDLLPFVEFEEYPELLSSIGANLAIAPLKDDEFNLSKSAIKYLEYSSCSYPSLLSPVGEYEEVVEDLGAPAILVKDDDWYERIKGIIEHPEEAQKMGKAAKNWVCAHRCLSKTASMQWAVTAKELLKK